MTDWEPQPNPPQWAHRSMKSKLMGIFKSEDAKDTAAAGALVMKEKEEEMEPFEN